MALIQKLLDKLHLRRRPPEITWRNGIVIPTTWGSVPESARRQAVINMRADPKKFMEVERVILRECKGDWELTKKTMRERYPEACPEGY